MEQEAQWFQIKYLKRGGGGYKVAHYILTPCNNTEKSKVIPLQAQCGSEGG